MKQLIINKDCVIIFIGDLASGESGSGKVCYLAGQYLVMEDITNINSTV